MSDNLTLRLRLPGGATHTLSIARSSTLAELRAAIGEVAEQPSDNLQLSSGFPPQQHTADADGTAVGALLQNMETVTVALAGTSGQAMSESKMKKPRKAKAPAAAAPTSGGMMTVSDLSGGGASSPRKRPVNNPGGGGGGGGGKRRAPKALSLGSEESIGDSMLAAASSGKGAAALHREDPALAFFKHAAGSALAHHYEEVLANHRFAAALGGTYTMEDSAGVRRSDGEPAQSEVEFKVGPRKKTREAFEVLSLPEVRGVIAAVLGELGGDAAKLELLKPFKMALVSPRVFWNLVRLMGGDVAAGLRQLLPAEDWSFLDERMARMSAKAEENERQREEEEAEAAARPARRRGGAAAPVEPPAPSRTGLTGDVAAMGMEAPAAYRSMAAAADEAPMAAYRGLSAADDEAEEPRYNSCGAAASASYRGLAAEAEEEEEEEGEGEAEPEEDDADGWEARGVEMLRRREYDYGCACIDKALRLRIEAAADDESESGGELHPPLARAWYLHGDALLRRAQAMVTLAAQDGGGDAPTPVTAPAEPPAPSRTGLTGDVAALGVADAGEWRASGSAAIGRRVRRFFALHGACDGAVVGWAPESDEGDEALWHVRLDDGDEEDLDGDELDDALAAAAEGRTLEQEVELLLEAAWEALEASVALYAKQPERAAERADAHGRLADAALQNDQPERAADEYAAARAVLDDEVKAGRLTNDDRRLADVEFSMGVVALRRGDVGGARHHYAQASATLRLRSANLQRRALDAQISGLSQQVAGGAAAGPSAAAAPVDAAADAAEVASIAELVAEIDARLVEIDTAHQSR